MVRQARKKSKTGIYHIMLRGNERKAVFIDDDDKNKFINIVLQKKKAGVAHVYAYCVMDNHVHMVIRELESGQALDTLMKRIGVSYAIYFNKKYERVGHVFQDRFRSEVIEDEAYFLCAIRYIHQNPVKAGMSVGLNYPWSSYAWYIGCEKSLPLLPEMEALLEMLSSNRDDAVKIFKTFHEEEEKQLFFDVVLNDSNKDNAKVILEKFLLCHKIKKEDLKKFENRTSAVELVRHLVMKTNLSGRQVADLTGLNREKVRTIILSKEQSP